jgi:hypothetical protein
MVDKVKLLLAPEPSEACEFRSFDMVFLVKMYMHVERRRAGGGYYKEQIERKDKKHPASDEDRWDEKVGRVVSFVAAIGRGNEMAPGIVRMMKSDVIPVKDAAKSMMTESVMNRVWLLDTTRWVQVAARTNSGSSKRNHRAHPTISNQTPLPSPSRTHQSNGRTRQQIYDVLLRPDPIGPP